ncbi:MAG TPA: hypothetical protein ENK02_10635 [Planctomycetes bacterium]|nr:hypothetical protein [Planctomycetota bacterium]
MQNWMGYELNEAEKGLVECYEKLASILQNEGEQLAPFEKRNALKALACLWQIANGLDMDPGQIYNMEIE